jgi:hypothetical protein
VANGPVPQNVQLLQVFNESTFGTDITASLASFLPVPFQEGSCQMTIGRNPQDPQTAVQYIDDYTEEVFGPKSWTLNFTMVLAPTGTAAGSATAAVQGCLGYLLAACMGGEDLGTGSTFSSGWTGSGGDVGSGAGFSKGTAIGWVNGSNLYEMRPLKNVSSNTLATKLAFSSSPANGNVAYSCATYYLTSDPQTSLQFVARSLEDDDDWVLMGGQLASMTLTCPLDGTLPTIQFAWQGVKWIYGADAAGSGSLGDISPATYSNFAPVSGYNGYFHTQVNGKTTNSGSLVNVSAVAFKPNITYVKIPSPSGIEGVLRWRKTRKRGPSIEGSYTTYFENTARFIDRDDKDDRLIWYQVGQTQGLSVALEAGTVQYGDVQRINGGDIASEMVPWKGRRDGDITSASGDQQLSPWRIHLG